MITSIITFILVVLGFEVLIIGLLSGFYYLISKLFQHLHNEDHANIMLIFLSIIIAIFSAILYLY